MGSQLWDHRNNCAYILTIRKRRTSQPEIQSSEERYLRTSGKPDPLMKVWNSIDMKLYGLQLNALAEKQWEQHRKTSFAHTRSH